MSDIDSVVEICGCTREVASHAIEAAGPGGVEAAVDLVLSSMSAHVCSVDDIRPVAKLVVLVRRDLCMGVGKVAAQCVRRRWNARLALQHVVLSSRPLIRCAPSTHMVNRVAHGALGAYRATADSGESGRQLLKAWEQAGETVIVLGVADEVELMTKLEQARQAGLVTHLVADAGRTEVVAGSHTVGTVGPDAIERIDAITGGLSLL